MLGIAVGDSPASTREWLAVVRVELGPVLLVLRLAVSSVLAAALGLRTLIVSLHRLAIFGAVGLVRLGLAGLVLLLGRLRFGSFGGHLGLGRLTEVEDLVSLLGIVLLSFFTLAWLRVRLDEDSRLRLLVANARLVVEREHLARQTDLDAVPGESLLRLVLLLVIGCLKLLLGGEDSLDEGSFLVQERSPGLDDLGGENNLGNVELEGIHLDGPAVADVPQGGVDDLADARSLSDLDQDGLRLVVRVDHELGPVNRFALCVRLLG